MIARYSVQYQVRSTVTYVHTQGCKYKTTYPIVSTQHRSSSISSLFFPVSAVQSPRWIRNPHHTPSHSLKDRQASEKLDQTIQLPIQLPILHHEGLYDHLSACCHRSRSSFFSTNSFSSPERPTSADSDRRTSISSFIKQRQFCPTHRPRPSSKTICLRLSTTIP